MTIKKSKMFQKVSLVVTMMSISAYTWAQGTDLGKVASNITKSITNLTKLVTAGAYVGGTAMFLVAVFQFRQHKENPTQTPLSKPMMFLAIAAALLFFPSLIKVTGATIFGASASIAGPGGFTPTSS